MKKAAEPDDGGTKPSQNLSAEEFIARRMAQSNPDPDPADPAADPGAAGADPVTVLGSDPNAPDQGDPPDDLIDDDDDDGDEPGEDKIDLLSLSPEEIQDLARRGKSRLLHRIGELTAKAHSLEAELQSRREAKPMTQAVPAEDNPYRDLKTVEEVAAKHSEFIKVAEETDRILEDHEDYGPDDIIEIDGQEFTKRKIRLANRNARDAMVKFLPAQHAELVRAEQRQALEAHCTKLIPIEVPELQDAESEIAKRHAAMLKDPLIDLVKQRVPDLAPQLSYLLAHAARSMARSTRQVAVKPATGAPPTVKVPGVPFGAGSGGGRIKRSNQADAAYQEFEKTGSPEAWIAARAARLAQ